MKRATSNPLLLIATLLTLPAGSFAENHVVTIGMQGFQPTEITIQTGDLITWRVEEGHHTVTAEDGSFQSGLLSDGGLGESEFVHTFNEPGEFPYTCSQHSDLYEAAHVQPLVIVEDATVSTGMDINFGHSGSWYNPEENGQGFSLEVVPDAPALQPGSGQLVAYWFTFATDSPGGAGNLRWYEGQGPIDGPDATLDVYQVSGGVFDDPAEATAEQIGAAILHFDSCSDASISYSLDLNGDGTEESVGEIALTRITPDVLCEELGGEENIQ